MFSTPEITHGRHRPGRRLRLRLHIAFACFAGVGLFVFCVFHGINKTDSLYGVEMAGAWLVFVAGSYSGARAFKRGNRSQRIIVLIALALLGTSVAAMTLLNRAPEFTVPSPSPAGVSE